LLDLEDPRFRIDDLQRFAEAVVPGEATLGAERVWRRSLSGLHLDVSTPETTSPPPRGLAELSAMVERSPLGERARAMTIGVLRRIAVAEGRVHDCSPEEVHFHEVGAVDTLIDVGGAALALERLGVERALVGPPLLGSGTVQCAHGTMPVPAPATAELLRGRSSVLGDPGAPMGERCTPTGAALLVALLEELGGGRDDFGADAAGFRSSAIGYGAGGRDPEAGPPNLLRVQLGVEGAGAASASSAVDELRVNLDDMTPEEIGALVQELRSAGALEVWTGAVSMKKDRPGVLLGLLCRSEQREQLVRVLFERSSTFGVRWSPVMRLESGRRFATIELDGVPVRIKVRVRPDYAGRSADGPGDLFVEHDDLVRLAEATGAPLRVARSRALAEAREVLGDP
ncbi:MAG: LarC family nickel insertion protein, partial [Planctomycetota bacterium]|nr:LarC family nickel insertion protein [Planctomycetota bacterium]